MLYLWPYTLSVNAPPMIEPTTDASPEDNPIKPVNTGLFLKGTNGSRIIVLPENTPADADPAMARPTMSAAEVEAAPHTADPISKMIREMINTHFVEYN